MKRVWLRNVAGLALAIASLCVVAGEVGIVSHIKVLSDKVEDVSSLDAWKASFLKEGMTDEQKALAIWTTVVEFRHQDPPPLEFLTGDGGDVHDPIKTFNVYGYNMCCCESSNICALARYAGLKARGWGINGHSVPEIFYGDAWHLYDASLICYFKKSDGSVAGVEDILTDVSKWYEKNPEYFKNADKLVKFMRNGGWKNGPPILANTSAYDNNGWLPAATHGWYSTMQEYDGRGGGKENKAFLYEYGYSQGYEVNIQLRPGEKLVRNWGNTGEHINQDNGGAPGSLNEKVGPGGQLRYSPALGDLTLGRIGNGTQAYSVPNAKELIKNGPSVIRMNSSYVYLRGVLHAAATVPDGSSVTFEISLNNGMTWAEAGKIVKSGDFTADIGKLINRHYNYLVRVTAHGSGMGLPELDFVNDIQHSQRALPALDKGDNKITFSTGPDEGTVTLEALGNLEHKGKQNTFLDFHPILENIKADNLILTGGTGSVAFPVKTPGDMTRLRFGCFYRARDAKDGWDYQVSFDGGKNYKTIDHAAGLTGNGACKYVTFSNVPPGTREALVRFSGTQRNTTMIANFRIDADYKEPGGGFRPVQVTYTWMEDGKEKKDVHVAKSAAETYTIHCDVKPVMGSIVLELESGNALAAPF